MRVYVVACVLHSSSNALRCDGFAVAKAFLREIYHEKLEKAVHFLNV